MTEFTSRHISMICATIVTTVLIHAALTCAASADDNPCLPLPPKKMLELLPDPPVGWELKRSQAQHTLAQWLTSSAERQYARIPEAGSPPADGAAMIRVHITDTGRHSHYTSLFAGFSVGESENMESLYIDSHPAMIVDLEEDGQMIDILVAKRFLVSFTFPGGEADNAKDWFKAVNVSAMKAAPGATVEKLPARGKLVRIDELRPERNRIQDTMLFTAADLEKQRAEDDEEAAERARTRKAQGFID